MKLAIHLLTWNGASYLPYLFDSLKKQTFLDWELHVSDNASTDTTWDFLQNEGHRMFERLHLTRYDSNRGFAAGHNDFFRKNDHDLLLILNQDMYLTPSCLEKLMDSMKRHPEVGAVAPRIMRWNFEALRPMYAKNVLQNNSALLQKSFTDSIDSLGLSVKNNRRVTDLFAGCDWNAVKSDFHKEYAEIFGVSGAMALFRKKALRYVAFSDGQVFDESYDSYKEDVDLAYRLSSAGFQSHVLLHAVAYHDRTIASQTHEPLFSLLRRKRSQPRNIRQKSYQNHIMTLLKNEYWRNALLDFFPIFWHESKKALYFFFTDPALLLKSLQLIATNFFIILRNRKEISHKRNISWKKIRLWWTHKT
ncbi:MAG: glycosyltransferase [Parcubacteria group bacterium]|nr:glycosyltransferase [Parcubacteria group bacterium]